MSDLGILALVIGSALCLASLITALAFAYRVRVVEDQIRTILKEVFKDD